MALAGANAALARPEREDVARAPEGGRGGGRVGEGATGQGAVMGGDAGCDGGVGGVDGDGVGGSVGVAVFEDHLGEGEGVG